jgi:hypothetical protein
LWSDFLDDFSNRPLAELGVHLAYSLAPNSLDGILWVALGLRLGTGLLAGAILGELLRPSPTRRAVSCMTTLLFIVNPSELSRFLAVGMVVYHMAVFEFVLSLWLYVKSYVLQRRLLLSLACLLLGLSGLSYESVLPFALLAPGLLWLMGREHTRPLWAAAWLGTGVILAARLTVFYMANPVGYQHYLVKTVTLGQVPLNLAMLMQPALKFLHPDLKALVSFWPLGLLTLGLAAALLWRVQPDSDSPGDARRLGLGLAFAVVGLLAGVGPYAMMPIGILRQILGEFGWLRTQYYAAVAQAAMYALAIALVGVALPRKVRALWIVGSSGVLLATAVTTAFRMQTERPLRNYPGGAFLGGRMEEVARVFREVDHLAPDLDRQTAVFFVLGQGVKTPFGFDYDLLALSCARLGVPAYHGTYLKGVGWVPLPNFGSPEKPSVYAFKGRVRAFKLSPDGSVAPFEPRGRIPEPSAEIDPSVACETWTVPFWMFDPEALAKGSIASTTFQRRRGDFLHFRGQAIDKLLGRRETPEPRFVENGR